MMKKCMLGLWLSFMMLGIAGYSQKVGMLMHSLMDDRWALDQKLFSDKVEELGGEVTVLLANGDADKQYIQTKELIEMGIQVIVLVAVDAEKAIEIVELASSSGVKVIAYDRMVPHEDLALYLSYDNIKVGNLQAQSAVDFGARGEYILINGPVSDLNAIRFREGQLQVLQPYLDKGQITIKEDIVLDNWGEVNAFISLLTIFEDIGNVKAILAANDGIALAVASAVADIERLKSIYLTGQDADLGAIKNIMKGYQDMTVYKPIAPLAEMAAEMAIRIAKGEKVEASISIVAAKKVPVVLLQPSVVTRENVESTVVKDGHVRMSDVLDQ